MPAAASQPASAAASQQPASQPASSSQPASQPANPVALRESQSPPLPSLPSAWVQSSLGTNIDDWKGFRVFVGRFRDALAAVVCIKPGT